jgi:hypothetical protein
MLFDLRPPGSYWPEPAVPISLNNAAVGRKSDDMYSLRAFRVLSPADIAGLFFCYEAQRTPTEDVVRLRPGPGGGTYVRSQTRATCAFAEAGFAEGRNEAFEALQGNRST